ncbi:MAG: peptidylprolyl isomerase [bacterium]
MTRVTGMLLAAWLMTVGLACSGGAPPAKTAEKAAGGALTGGAQADKPAEGTPADASGTATADGKDVAAGETTPTETTTAAGGGTGRDAIDPMNKVAIVHTNAGDIYVMFYPEEAPLHTKNFMYLAENHAYDKSPFHRCVPDFVIQGGEIHNPDWKEPEVSIKNEASSKRKHLVGALAAARGSDPNSATSQFYFVVNAERTKPLDTTAYGAQYTVYGQAFKGLDVITKIVVNKSNWDSEDIPPDQRDPATKNPDGSMVPNLTNNDLIETVEVVDATPFAAEITAFKQANGIE